jgi:hypothetical protein
MFRTHECDVECVHSEICNFKDEYNNLFNALLRGTYSVGEGKHKKIGDSSITVFLKCPYFIKRGADNG